MFADEINFSDCDPFRVFCRSGCEGGGGRGGGGGGDGGVRVLVTFSSDN